MDDHASVINALFGMAHPTEAANRHAACLFSWVDLLFRKGIM